MVFSTTTYCHNLDFVSLSLRPFSTRLPFNWWRVKGAAYHDSTDPSVRRAMRVRWCFLPLGLCGLVALSYGSKWLPAAGCQELSRLVDLKPVENSPASNARLERQLSWNGSLSAVHHAGLGLEARRDNHLWRAHPQTSVYFMPMDIPRGSFVEVSSWLAEVNFTSGCQVEWVNS